MNPIEFQILFYEREQHELNRIGIRPPIQEANTRPITFYSIDHIFPYFEDDDTEMTTIVSGGIEYIVDLTYEQVKNLIE